MKVDGGYKSRPIEKNGIKNRNKNNRAEGIVCAPRPAQTFLFPEMQNCKRKQKIYLWRRRIWSSLKERELVS